jgi:hypothetical protein
LISLQTFPGQIGFLVDDEGGPTPPSAPVQVTTTSTGNITWSATIFPAVSWLSLVPPASGTVSAASADDFTLEATGRPEAYGMYTTQVVVTATLPSGTILGPAITEARITYVPELHEYLFPVVLINGRP